MGNCGSGICPLCNTCNETVDHLFFDCVVSKGVWQDIMPRCRIFRLPGRWHREVACIGFIQPKPPINPLLSSSSSSYQTPFVQLFRTTTVLSYRNNLARSIKRKTVTVSAFKVSVSNSSLSSNSYDPSTSLDKPSTSLDKPSSNSKEDPESTQLFEKLKNAERERINNLEELDRKANVQLERQLVMASDWSRALLSMRGKLKGTEWDPENSHRISFSDFMTLLNCDNVQHMEYSNYGQTISVILPYYKDEKIRDGEGGSKKDIIFRRHVVDRMPIDCWNEVWKKLHHQIINVDVINVDTVPAEVYSTVATAVIWSMRLALSIGLYFRIDNMMRPIYAKLIPTDLGKPTEKSRQPIKRRALGSLGKSRAKFISAEEKTGVTFDDFAGQEYIKRELQEIVRILKNDEEFQNKGIYCPKGVLLHGPPGTGKTLLAKAIAGEAGLPFFAANGTDFVEMFVGVAASRVKDLFASARSFSPSIIFIDEIDAIGSKRGGPDIGGGGAEREQGLLQILTEMDGFKVSTAQVLIIGATNRLDILDPALLRKGRFDKIIRVGLPSKDGRLAILKVHARNKFFRSEAEKDLLLQEIAEHTEDFTGAELQNILNEAGILTARKDQDYIGREELLEALKRQKGTFETGQEDSTEVPEELKLRLAYREAAVAVLACYFPDPYRPFVETDINSIRSQPNMRYVETSGRVFAKKEDYVNSIVRACAPRVIEEEMFGANNLCWISAKATLEASRLAEFLILQTGMTAFGKSFYRNHNDLVPNLAAKLEALRDEYLRFAVEECLSVLREYYSAVETITDILLEKGEIKAEEIWDTYNRAPRIPQPPVYPVDEHGALIYAGRWGIHGISLPGRVTFAPGNVGFATFGAPRPMETQVISDETWKLIDGIWDKNVEEIRAEPAKEIEEEKEKPQLLLASHFL
ncbi:probable inactive ATP-dependent zinc metalloprotease FTSHI 4, chloroplastic [Rutidosis leptorrhynchoides]|uniref:probable inactive ATP-dependent zinc metalloprotease FTSHI 4, chloroplastic n=1 Tax=Rutidosis leptorrhynchoides TaxID=125765 RepID=UPI003A9A48A9